MTTDKNDGARVITHDQPIAADVIDSPRGQDPESPPDRSLRRSAYSWLAPSRIGGVYVLIVIIIVFSITSTNDFASWATFRQVVNGSTITALASMALVLPLSAGVFDVSVPYTMTLTGVVAAYAVAHGAPVIVAVLLSMCVALAVGAFNALVVVGARIDSLIGTLATGSLLQAFVSLVTNDNSINSVRFYGTFSNIGQKVFHGIAVPVLYVVVVAAVIWYLLEHTASGRRLYATGFNLEAARLAGVRTNVLRIYALMGSSVIAGITGIVLASQLSSGSPTAGTSYLLPAFAAVFLGATQLKDGRFNAWGTVIAVLLLGVGTTGLALSNAPSWAGNMFTGVVLIASLAVTGLQRRGSPLLGRIFNRWRTPAPTKESGLASD